MRANSLLRVVYIAAGVAVILASLFGSTARSPQIFPILLGALLIFQGWSGA